MKPKYTATDLFKLRKTLKLLWILEKNDESFVDTVFERMNVDSRTTRDLKSLFKIHFKDFIDEKLPGLTENRLKIISKEYKEKKAIRFTLKSCIETLHLNNRLLPFKNNFYASFAKKSSNHFLVVYNVHLKHIYGKERISYGSVIREVK